MADLSDKAKKMLWDAHCTSLRGYPKYWHRSLPSLLGKPTIIRTKDKDGKMGVIHLTKEKE